MDFSVLIDSFTHNIGTVARDSSISRPKFSYESVLILKPVVFDIEFYDLPHAIVFGRT